AKSANLEDSKGDISNVGPNNYIILNIDYATKQQWGDSRHDNNGNTNHSFCRADSLILFLFVAAIGNLETYPEYIKHLRKFINAMEKKSITKPDKEIDSKPSFTEEESNHNKCFRT
ncbi:hypothetical protein Goari_008191, partial [Gossypium aridum]|nr:hypothetical protein [Gossypium aridum]